MICVRDENSWNIEPKDTKNIYFLIRKVLKHWTKWNKKSIFNLFLSWEHFNSFCIECATWQNLILYHIKSLLYIYIYIYIDVRSAFSSENFPLNFSLLAEPPKRTYIQLLQNLLHEPSVVPKKGQLDGSWTHSNKWKLLKRKI